MDPFVGEIRIFAGNFAPSGWAFCEGQLLAVSQYDALFSLFGTFYGGDGRTTFGVPDLRGRLPIHQGQGPGLPNYNIGTKAGTETVTLTADTVAAHSHTYGADSGAGTGTTPIGSYPAGSGSTAVYQAGASNLVAMKNDAAPSLQNTGGGQPHNNVMPFQCIYFIVSLTGVYPSRT